MDSSVVTVSQLWHYPIKSCRGIPIERAVVGPREIVDDRRWMIVQPDGTFLTQREQPRLAVVTPSLWHDQLHLAAPGAETIAVPLSGGGPEFEVVVWHDRCAAVDEGDALAQWLSAFLGLECRLVRMADDWVRSVDPVYAQAEDQVGFADGFPLLLASESSLADLNRRLAQPLPMDRFRPNLVIKGAAPFEEDRWRVIRIGTMTLRVVKPCARCVTTTVDQARGVADGPEPLATLAMYRKQDGKVMFAQNVIHASEGIIVVGDNVEVITTTDD